MTDTRSTKNPADEAGSSDQRRDDVGDKLMFDKDFTTKARKNIGIVETADDPIDAEPIAKLNDPPDAGDTGATVAHQIPGDRLHMELRKIVKETLGDDLKMEKASRAFAREQGLPIGTVRRTAKGICKEIEGRERNRKGEDSAPKSRQSQIKFKLSSKGKPLALVFNALQVLNHDPRWKDALGFDEFAERPMLLKRPPYDHGHQDWTPRPLEDQDDIEAAGWMQGEFDLPVSSAIAAEAIQVMSRRNRYHPIRDYLSPLKWDGVPRLDTWLIDYFGAEDTPYVRAVGSKTLIAAVARIYLPGCKVDTVLILDSPQGLLKSTAWRTLTGPDWFTDYMPDLHSKDAMQQLSGKWIIEFAELAAMTRSEVEATKRFISSQQDDFRPSYGRRRVTFKRQCVFVGTSNETCYLKDSTGNRRFWPVTVTKRCDIPRLRRERDQLWAEAVHRFQQGERWHLTGELEQQAAARQAARIDPDSWEAPIMGYLQSRQDITFITSGTVLENALGIESKRDWTPMAEKRAASILKRNGWKHMNKRIDGVQTKGFLRPIPLATTQPEEPCTGSKTATGATDENNHNIDSSNGKNFSNINNVTAATDATGTYRDRQHVVSGDSSGSEYAKEMPLQNTSPRFKETSGSSGNTGNNVDSIDIFGVTAANADTGSSSRSDINTASSHFESQPDLGDDYMNSLVESLQPVISLEPEITSQPRVNDDGRSGFDETIDATPAQTPEPVIRAHCNDCQKLDPCKAGCRLRVGVIAMEQRATPPCNGADFEPVEMRS